MVGEPNRGDEALVNEDGSLEESVDGVRDAVTVDVARVADAVCLRVGQFDVQIRERFTETIFSEKSGLLFISIAVPEQGCRGW